MTTPERFDRDLAEVARSMHHQATPASTMHLAVEAARMIITGCEIAAVSIATKNCTETPVLTDPGARTVDEWQYEIDEGPCFDALAGEERVHSNDLATDPRWPRWGPRAVSELGMHSALSLRLFTGGKTLGVLNLYGRPASAFTADDITHGTNLAAHVAVALAAALDTANLVHALDNRTLIGQATGLVMARFDIGAGDAFSTLTRMSQTRNVKLHALAHEIVETRHIPDSWIRDTTNVEA